jgi:hypothetical protein
VRKSRVDARRSAQRVARWTIAVRKFQKTVPARPNGGADESDKASKSVVDPMR